MWVEEEGGGWGVNGREDGCGEEEEEINQPINKKEDGMDEEE